MYSSLKKIQNLLERIDNDYHDYKLLTESQESKSIEAAKKLVMKELYFDNERADHFVRVELRGDLPVLRTRNGGKFILGVTRMYCNGELDNAAIIQNLNSTLELVASDTHINEYDRNLNGMSAQDLINQFSSARKTIGDKDREEVGALELQVNNNYTIDRIDDFDAARPYGYYTSWCVTHNENMLDSYTSGGIGQFYFCLKNGFENIPKEEGQGCPLDEYGLSMIAVSVDGDGQLNTCTCRWNHDNGGNDHIMNTQQISQLIGRNFYEVFKPNNKLKNFIEELLAKVRCEIPLDEVFETVREENDDYAIVGTYFDAGRNQWGFADMKFNILDKKTNTFVTNEWYEYIYHVTNTDRFVVETNTMLSNVVTLGGKFMLGDFVSSIEFFIYENKDYYAVRYDYVNAALLDSNFNNATNETYNSIRIGDENPTGKYVCQINERNGSTNLIDIHGNRLYDKENSSCLCRFDGNAAVKNGVYSENESSQYGSLFYYDTKGIYSLVFSDGTEWKKWYKKIGRICTTKNGIKEANKDIFAVCDINDNMRIIDKNENIVSQEVYDSINSEDIQWLRLRVRRSGAATKVSDDLIADFDAFNYSYY